MDIYLDLNDELGTNLSARVFNLGQVCCRQTRECDCSWIVTDGDTGDFLLELNMDDLNDETFSLGYDCAKEVTNCMDYCRRVTVSASKNFTDVDKPGNTYTENDFFLADGEFFGKMCSQIAVTFSSSDWFGIKRLLNLYTRYNRGRTWTAANQDLEDLHVSGFCCSNILANEFFANRYCINSTLLLNMY